MVAEVGFRWWGLCDDDRWVVTDCCDGRCSGRRRFRVAVLVAGAWWLWWWAVGGVGLVVGG
ncbi:hypothetical protein Hanom_Chr14g01322991 [Helianthus anomalus]